MNLDSSEYTIIDDTIIIHWTVNKPIGTIDEKFKKLIFSDHADINISIQHGNNYNENIYLKGSLFNQSITLTNFLTHLTLGYEFNQSIELANIKYLNIDCNNLHLIEN